MNGSLTKLGPAAALSSLVLLVAGAAGFAGPSAAACGAGPGPVSHALPGVVPRHRPAPRDPGAPDPEPGQVFSFGDVDSYGMIPPLEQAIPTAVTGIRGSVVQVAASNSDGYALTAGGKVFAWGAGRQGELGNGSRVHYVSHAVQVRFPPGVQIAALADPMPFDSALAIDTEGFAWGWGANTAHSLCLPRRGPFWRPRRLPLREVTLATGARSHSLLLAGGEVEACGDDVAGQLGIGSRRPSPGPSPVVGLPEDRVVALVSSWEGSGALTASGAYYDWGFNREGQLGNGTRRDSAVPVRVALPAPVVQVAQGGSNPQNGQTLALLADGSLWAWGDGTWGQLGRGGYSGSLRPVKVDLPSGLELSTIATGGYSSYAVSTSGFLWAWGSNRYGELGVPTPEPASATPLLVGPVVGQISATDLNVVAANAPPPLQPAPSGPFPPVRPSPGGR